MLPTINEFISKYGLENFVVVADSGLMNNANIAELEARGTGFPHSQIKDRDTSYVPFYTQTNRGPYMYLFRGFESVQGIGTVSEIKMSVDKVLALAKTITTIQIKLPLNKEVYTQTMLMTRHQKIAKLFDEDFWVTQ